MGAWCVTIVEAVILGIIQGVTEFLPVSSSGHLVLAQHWLGIAGDALTFDVMVHAGSLLAIVVVLRHELASVIQGLLGGRTPEARAGRRLFWQLVVATLPLVAVGLLLRDWVDEAFSSPYVSIALLFVTGVVLLYADRASDVRIQPIGAPAGRMGGFSSRVGGAEATTWLQAAWMGISQAFAVLPGLSRSGITMSTGMVTGLSRESAARFSFLMSIPAILGATVLEGRGLVTGEVVSVASPTALAVGAAVSAVVTYLAVVLFLRFVRNGRLAPFAYYTWALAAVMLWLTF